jgi:hypothetical protein
MEGVFKTKSDYNGNFKNDLKIGVQFERKITPLLELLFNSKIKESCDNSNYDILLENDIKIEVKNDKRFEKTGNVFIEWFNYGKPSGISITKADYYAIANNKTVVIISVDCLKEIINNCQYDRIADTNINKGYLISENILRRYASFYSELPLMHISHI